MNGRPIGAVIFDMDGLLIDSEPLWHEAEVTIFGGLGVPLGRDDTRSTKGMFVDEVSRYWYERFPWEGPSPEQVGELIVDEVERLVHAKAQMRPGVEATLEQCERRGLPKAVASSSSFRLIESFLGHFGLRDRFVAVHSAEVEPYGKPNPAVFLSTAQMLGVPRQDCLVLEDAPAGVLAAKAGGMFCLVVPEAGDRTRPEMALADVVVGSLADIDENRWVDILDN